MTSFPCPPLTFSQVLVDDSDSHIQYSPEWQLEGAPGLECHGTTHVPQINSTVNSTAVFSFVGVHVEVFGTIGVQKTAPTSMYQVDDLPISTYTFPLNGVVNYRVPFYLSPLLELESHTLTMVVPPGDAQIFLDYIVYDSGLESSSVTPSSTSSLTSISSPALISPSASILPSASISLSNSHSFSSLDVIASGVAGSLGGVIVGVALAVAFLHFFPRRCTVPFRALRQSRVTQ
ncbi:hypothetical protein EV360DRAFT_90820, partial [Lentinula raphanica]